MFARNKDGYISRKERNVQSGKEEKRKTGIQNGKRKREREEKSAIEMERSGKEAANVHPSPCSLPPLTTPLHINPPLIRVESIARVYVISRLRSFRVSCDVTVLLLKSIFSLALIRSRFHGPNTPPLRWPQDSPGVGRSVRRARGSWNGARYNDGAPCTRKRRHEYERQEVERETPMKRERKRERELSSRQ